MKTQLPTLIQRIARRQQDREDSKGVDKLFELDYMGSSEFEWGAVPKALKAMRAAVDATWQIRPIMERNSTCYYIGPENAFGTATQLFNDQLKPHKERLGHAKRPSYLFETYFPTEAATWPLGPCHGWWAIDAAIPFVLFKDKNHAEDFLKVL